MKTPVVLLLIIGSSLAVPIDDLKDLERIKKSPSFGAPCAGGAQLTPVSLYMSASAPQPQYRENEHANEDHKRAYYETAAGAPAAAIPAIAHHVTPAYSGAGIAGGYAGGHSISLSGAEAQGPAIGLFPNAKVGGCNIPLLLSCAPNVIAGQLASHAYSAPAYRSFDGDLMRETDWMKSMRAASHHKISEDYPEPQQGSHHTISKDYPEPNLTRIIPVQHHQNHQNHQIAHPVKH